MRRSRSTSSWEYSRVPFGERLGSISPRASYIRSVCGMHVGQLGRDRDHEHAAVRGDLHASSGWFVASPSSFLSCRPVARALEQLRARVAVHHLRKPVHRLLLLGRELCRHVDQEAVVDVAPPLAAEPAADLRPAAAARSRAWCRAPRAGALSRSASGPRPRLPGSPRGSSAGPRPRGCRRPT